MHAVRGAKLTFENIFPKITATPRLQLAFSHFSPASLWPPTSGCPEAAISRLEWEDLSVHSSKCDDWLGWGTHGSSQFHSGLSAAVFCLAWCPWKVTSMWDNIYTTISCLAGLLWMQEKGSNKAGAGGKSLPGKNIKYSQRLHPHCPV